MKKKSKKTEFLKPIKTNLNQSFFLPIGTYGTNGTYNKYNEKINLLQFDLEKSKETIIQLNSQILEKNKEINELKEYKKKCDKKDECYHIIKLIEAVLKLLDSNYSSSYSDLTQEKNYYENNIQLDTTITNGSHNQKYNQSTEMTKNEITNERLLPPDSSYKEKSPKRDKPSKEMIIINSFKKQINKLKEIINKKEEEINKNKTNTMNYSKLQFNIDKNYQEIGNIRKENELMRTKIENLSNLIFIEKEGNKSLKSKLNVYQSSFREFQENSSKKNIDLEAQLAKAHDKERECKFLHIIKGYDFRGNSNSSRNSKKNIYLNDRKRLLIVKKEIKNMIKNIESENNNIINSKNENSLLESNRSELEKQLNKLKENNNNLKNEINELDNNMKNLNNIKNNLENERINMKIKYYNSQCNLKKEKNLIIEIKDIINKKQEEIDELKKQIEKIKSNQIFKNGSFKSNLRDNGKKNNEKIENAKYCNIEEEINEIEHKYQKPKNE